MKINVLIIKIFVSGQIIHPQNLVSRRNHKVETKRKENLCLWRATVVIHMWINSQQFSLKRETNKAIKLSEPLPPCRKQTDAIFRNNLHNPRSTLVAHGKPLRVPHRWSNLCRWSFHTSETWRLVRVACRNTQANIFQHSPVTFEIHEERFSET